MNSNRAVVRRPRAFTLVELSLVVMVLLALVGISFKVVGNSKGARLGREAAEALRSVHTAQRMYLAEHPSTLPSALTGALLVPYLPTRATSMPTVKSLTGTTLNIKVTVFPPVVDNGSGGTYDPSGDPKDLLWDVGE